MFTFGLDCDQLALLLSEWQATCLHFDDENLVERHFKIFGSGRTPVWPLKKVAGAEDWLADWLTNAGPNTRRLIFG